MNVSVGLFMCLYFNSWFFLKGNSFLCASYLIIEGLTFHFLCFVIIEPLSHAVCNKEQYWIQAETTRTNLVKFIFVIEIVRYMWCCQLTMTVNRDKVSVVTICVYVPN